MSRASSIGGIAFFCLKFIVFSAVFLFLWWWKVQPTYVGLIGRLTGAILQYIAQNPIEATLVEVDSSGVLSTKTSLEFVVKGQSYPIDAAFLVVNIPPYIALVLATPGLGLKRLVNILLSGLGILALGHILFLTLVFEFSAKIQESPEIPTAAGLFLMTLPFMLWIVLAYWDRLMQLFEEPAEAGAERDAESAGESPGE